MELFLKGNQWNPNENQRKNWKLVKIKKGISVAKFMATKSGECKCCGIKALHTYEDYVIKKRMWEQMMHEEMSHPSTDLSYLK